MSQQDHVRLNLPLWRYLSVAVALAAIATGLWRDWPALAVAGVLILGLLLLLQIIQYWTVRQIDSASGLDIPGHMYRMSQARPIDRLMSINLGQRATALALSKNLTSGRLYSVNVFNPSLAPHVPRHADSASPGLGGDPRLIWYDGSLELLPVPDNQVRVVFLDRVLSELDQEGDRLTLLREVVRVLEPNGRVVVAEMADSWPNRLAALPVGHAPRSAAYWHNLLTGAGLQVTATDTVQDLLLSLRAEKWSPYAGRQLAFDLVQ